MQKPQLKSPVFLAIQNTYQELEIALFNGSVCADVLRADNKSASKIFIPLVQKILTQNSIPLDTLNFIAVNQGPGPFTTLRTILASVNGLSFATNIPLIGIDGLIALLLEHRSTKYLHTIALLNAFNKDVYFGIEKPEKKLETGYNNIFNFLTDISGTPPTTQNFTTNLEQISPRETIRFIGNGTELYKNAIQDTFGLNAYIPTILPLTCSITQIGLMGLKRWQQHDRLTCQLLPLYLKKHAAQM